MKTSLSVRSWKFTAVKQTELLGARCRESHVGEAKALTTGMSFIHNGGLQFVPGRDIDARARRALEIMDLYEPKLIVLT